MKTVLRALSRLIESLKSGIWQQAEPDQQSEVVDQVESLREWLRQEDRDSPLVVTRLQWCARALTAEFFKKLSPADRTLVESAVEDLRQAVKPGRK